MLDENTDSSAQHRLKLASRRDVEVRLHNLVKTLSEIYGSVVLMGERFLDTASLVLTQPYLESDKLGLVLRETLLNAYNVPVIAILGEGGVHYVIDGHHRVLVNAWLRRRTPSLLLSIPSYAPHTRYSLLDISVFNPPDTPSYLLTWRHMVNTIRFLEKLHGRIAWVWLESLPVESLRPTQEIIISRSRLGSVTSDPVLVYYYQGEYYVIDGHTRVCRNVLEGHERVRSVVFTLGEEIGIVRRARLLRVQQFSREACMPRV